MFSFEHPLPHKWSRWACSPAPRLAADKHCSRSVIPLLADSHFVVAPRSSRPEPDQRPGEGFAKISIAAELALLVTGELGFPRFHIVGHDWGGVVACSLAAHHPELVASLTVVDVAIPSSLTPSMSQGAKPVAPRFPPDSRTPRSPRAGREGVYLNWFYDNCCASPEAVAPADRAE